MWLCQRSWAVRRSPETLGRAGTWSRSSADPWIHHRPQRQRLNRCRPLLVRPPFLLLILSLRYPRRQCDEYEPKYRSHKDSVTQESPVMPPSGSIRALIVHGRFQRSGDRGHQPEPLHVEPRLWNRPPPPTTSMISLWRSPSRCPACRLRSGLNPPIRVLTGPCGAARGRGGAQSGTRLVVRLEDSGKEPKLSDVPSAIVVDLTEAPRRVQGTWVPDGRRHSDTELARVIAQHSEWRFTSNGELLDSTDLLIAETITAAAESMRKLGWFTAGRMNTEVTPASIGTTSQGRRVIGQSPSNVISKSARLDRGMSVTYEPSQVSRKSWYPEAGLRGC